MQREEVSIRLRRKGEQYEKTSSREGTVEEGRGKRRGDTGIMGNDKAREAGYAGRAWAVHSEDRGWSGVAQPVNQRRWQWSLRAG